MSRVLDSVARGKVSAPAFAGRLAAVSLFDAIQFLLINRKTGTLTVRSGSSVAYLTFSEGQIMTALDEALREGEPVVERAVQWTEGTFEFAPGPVPPDRKIQSSTDNVLLEAARRIDEAHAGEIGDDGHSLEAELVEKQARGSALSEAFRSAMAGCATGSRLRGWRSTAVRELSRRDSLRLLLGPGSHVTLVSPDGARSLPEISASEVTAWMDELAPRSVEPSATRRESGPLRQTVLPDGDRLWAQRHSSSEGDWLSVSLAARRLPQWSELGLEESLLEPLESMAAGILLLVSVNPDGPPSATWPGMALLAAWLAHRAAKRPEIGWIVETLPRYDWSVLPGRVRSVSPSKLRRAGAVESLCQASGASLLVLAESSDPMLSEARRLAREGVRVVQLSTSSGADSRRIGSGSPDRSATPAGEPGREFGLVWEVRSSPPPTRLPFAVRVLPGF